MMKCPHPPRFRSAVDWALPNSPATQREFEKDRAILVRASPGVGYKTDIRQKSSPRHPGRCFTLKPKRTGAILSSCTNDDGKIQHSTPRPRRLHGGLTVWFTGLSGAGKTTLAQRVFEELSSAGYEAEMLDADVMRQTICAGLGFSRMDRDTNVRRLAFVADILTRHNVVVLVTAISPFRTTRGEIRQTIRNFVEVYVNAPLHVCEERDTKGLYRRARLGEFKDVTGIDHQYEPPLRPEIECRTAEETIDDSTRKILAHLLRVL
jgi:adenylylsulfate kinase